MDNINEEFANLVQEAAVMVTRTAGSNEDMVKSVGDLTQSLTEHFEKGGIDTAKTYLEAVTKARQKAAPPNPDFA